MNTKGFFLQDLRRSIVNPGFFAGTVFALAILLPPAVLDMPLDGSRSYLFGFGNIFHASGFSPFAAIFPVLAYASVFCEEYHSGYLRMILHRSGFARFLRVRTVTVACSGGVVIAVPVAVVCMIDYAGGAHGIPAGSDEGLLAGSLVIEAITRYGDWYVIAGKVLLGNMGRSAEYGISFPWENLMRGMNVSQAFAATALCFFVYIALMGIILYTFNLLLGGVWGTVIAFIVHVSGYELPFSGRIGFACARRAHVLMGESP